ncbi:CubicO group peptidase (beta-lactamase class C family) [Caulobacter ginsengisoli]|uniref:CubicO group peptidase (Beta-lactamase class C family) n=1 Tax=Caulobacter ginsengisoli TaxID=400775 RepID=A0ABU0IVP9_9CAUL|nr:serine hydrolase domain-containing protein [Caulobacter ginsengisoli]MDQ0466089.1 CubicO group peptidase (beta-lactamase class C family) [Caulobacter ginsengisoli]
MGLINRRAWLGLAAGAAAAPAMAATAAGTRPWAVTIPSPGQGDYAGAIERIRACAEQEMTVWGLPGMTLAITDERGFEAIISLGWADRGARKAVQPGHYFQIGSISKSFAGLALFRLADQGKLDLSAPAARVLPGAAWPDDPGVTVARLLSHTSGLPGNAPIFPPAPDQTLWTGFAPGSGFSYSNTAYALLGKVLTQLTGLSTPQALQDLVMRPLGLTGMLSVIRSADRHLFPLSYWPALSDRAPLVGGPLDRAPWVESDFAAGSISATAAMMARYARFLMAAGRGQGGPLMSDAAMARFVKPQTPAEEFGKGARYAHGLAVTVLDDHDCLFHTGGMVSFNSALTVDPVSGVGAFASVNAGLIPYRPRATTNYACQVLRAVVEGRPLPDLPTISREAPVENAADYLGVYGQGSRFEVKPAGQGLALDGPQGHARMELAGPDVFSTDDGSFAPLGLRFVREGEKVIGCWCGGTFYGRGGAAGPPADPRLRALAGTYFSNSPWEGIVRVFAQGEELVMGGAILKPAPDGTWRFEDPELACERVRFEAPLSGRPSRLSLSGSWFERLEDGVQ